MSNTLADPRRGFADAHVPDSVRSAAQSADDMIRALNGAPNGTGTPPLAEGQDGGALGATPANAGGEGDAGMQPGPQSGAATPAAPPAGGEPPVAAPIDPATAAMIARLEQEVRTWKGRFDAEMPRARAEREALERQLAELRASAAAAVAEAVPTTEPVNDEEMEQYGSDLFNLMERFLVPKMETRVAATMAALEARINARFASINTHVETAAATVEETKANLFLSKLDSAISTWREIDNSAPFNEWLNEEDVIFGTSRRIGLDDAVVKRDATRVIKVIRAFLNQQDAGGSQPSPARQGVSAPGTGVAPAAPEAGQPAPTLEDFAAPGRAVPGQSAPIPGQIGPQNWTLTAIKAFYAQRARGVYRDSPAEADRIERDIAKAQREGRVTE